MIDLHLHTTASDGRLAPPDLVRAAAAAGLRTIAVTDHDTVGGLAAARAAGAELGLRVIDGIEVTAVEDGRDVHILGYLFDSADAGLAAFLRAQRVDRVRRVREIAARLASLGCAVDVEPIVASADADSGRTVGRPQIADALVAAGHATDRRDAFDRLLAVGRPAFVARRGPDVAEAVRIIRRAGGVSSMAHPALTAMDTAIDRFAAAGLDAIEARHSDHTPDDTLRYRRTAAELGLLTTAGSDYHADPSQHGNTLGIISMEPGELAALEALAGRRASASRSAGPR